MIGKGSPGKAGSAEAHGSALGEKEVAATRAALGWTHPPFEVPKEVYAGFDARVRGGAAHRAWRERFAAYRRGTDFIQRHIFPGGMLPSPQVFERRAASADFSVLDRHAFGMDYARTLAHWHSDFEAAWPQIAAQGFDERFRRLWRFYLAYCEAAFTTGDIELMQFTLQK